MTVALYEDRTATLGIHDITGPGFRGPFTPVAGKIPNYGFSNSAIWVRCTATNSSDADKEKILEVLFPGIDYVEVYLPDATGGYQVKRGGDMVPFRERDLPNRNSLFIIPLQPHQQKIFYVRIRNGGALTFNVQLWDAFEYYRKDHVEQYALGIYFGIIIVMILYNFFIFISTRERGYLLYTVQLTAVLFLGLATQGLAFELLWPDSLWWASQSHPIFTSLGYLTTIAFTWDFMNIRNLSRPLDRAYRIFFGCVVVILLLNFFVPYWLAIKLNTYAGPFFIASLVAAGWIGIRRHYRPAKFFVAGWSVPIIGAVLYNLNHLQVIQRSTASDFGVHIGMALQSIIFAFALADKINVFRNEKEKAQHQALENMEKMDRLKDEFLANTSHELRTPLIGIIGIAESLINGVTGELSGETKANLSAIIYSGKRLSNLVNDLLDFSRLKNSDLAIQQRPLDLRQVASVVMTVLQPIAAEKSLYLENGIPTELHPVSGDENRMQQVFYNLIGNAIKFTDNGGVTVTARDMGTMSEIVVSDTGIGIPEEKLRDIFKSFEQVDASITRERGGTGLGLAITKQLVELHSGSIYARPRAGGGSDFVFTIPFHAQSAAPDHVAAENFTGNLPDVPQVLPGTSIEQAGETLPETGPLILAVDDEAVNLLVLRNYLTMEGYRIVTAENGTDALEKLRSGIRPDLVILDVMMPRMSGFEVAVAIREQNALYDLPILILTVKNNIAVIVAGFDAGANDYLTKPFDRRELLARVEMLILLKHAVHEKNRLLVIEQELTIARRIQNSVLPVENPKLPHFAFEAYYQPIQSVGGDFYDYHIIDDRRIGVLVADVSGHGIPAALIAAMVKIAFSLQRPIAGDPVRVLIEMNRILFGKCENKYVTACYVLIDLERSVMVHAGAGHPPVILRKGGTGILEISNPKGRVLGVFQQVSCESRELPIGPGDRIILYTDGITECRNKDASMFDEERFHALVRKKVAGIPAEMIEAVTGALADWRGAGVEREDDVTMVVIDILG